jgi:hypothetical protein
MQRRGDADALIGRIRLLDGIHPEELNRVIEYHHGSRVGVSARPVNDARRSCEAGFTGIAQRLLTRAG